MKSSSGILNRRQFLHGAGVSMLVPQMCSLANVSGAATAAAPRRFLGLYVGHGFAISNSKTNRGWSWYPTLVDGKMVFGKSMEPMQPFADRLTVLEGLEHPQMVSGNGHSSADSFLNGSNPQAAVISPSIDQVAALAHGRNTRFPSMVLGNEGGIGSAGTSMTLSFNRAGRPIPASNNLVAIYNRLFNSDPKFLREEKMLYERSGSLVDRVLLSAKDLQRKAGAEDNEKLQAFLAGARAVEKNIERMEKWSDTPKPEVGSDNLSLNATVNEPERYIRTMYDLIHLAFQTDSMRFATYMLQSMGGGPWNDISKFALGIGDGHHSLAHNAKNDSKIQPLARYDLWQAKLLAEFIGKLADTPEGGGTMLDNTIVLYGSSNSKTHVNRDYPLMVAGGGGLGLRQGQYLDLTKEDIPMSNLLLTLLHRLDVPAEKFSDSTGVIPQMLA